MLLLVPTVAIVFRLIFYISKSNSWLKKAYIENIFSILNFSINKSVIDEYLWCTKDVIRTISLFS